MRPQWRVRRSSWECGVPWRDPDGECQSSGVLGGLLVQAGSSRSTKGVAVWTGQRFILGASEPERTFQTVILKSHSKKAINPEDGRLRTSLGNNIMGQLVKSVAFAPKCLDHVFCIFPHVWLGFLCN